MYGPLICYATKCTDGLKVQDAALGLVIAVAAVVGIVLLIKWLTPGDD